MLRSIFVLIFVIVVCFDPGTANQTVAAAAPAITTLVLIGASFMGHTCFEPKGYYRYRQKAFPAEVLSGPHFLQKFDTHFFEDALHQIWIGDNSSGEWLLRKDWEKIHGIIEDGDLIVRAGP